MHNKYFDKLLKLHNIDPYMNDLVSISTNNLYSSSGLEDTDLNEAYRNGADLHPQLYKKKMVGGKKYTDYETDVLLRANNLFIGNLIAQKTCEVIKGAITKVIKNKPVVNPTYRTIKGAIDLNYGGGFLIFDSEFNFKEIRHVFYEKDTTNPKQIIKPLDEKTDSNGINQFISDLLYTSVR